MQLSIVLFSAAAALGAAFVAPCVRLRGDIGGTRVCVHPRRAASANKVADRRVAALAVNVPTRDTPRAGGGDSLLLTEGPFSTATASFSRFVNEELWLADRTLYLPRLVGAGEQAKLLTRPRRFGKTLVLDTFAEYLDVKNGSERFDELFGRFAVGKIAPEERASAGEYFVLRLDFSRGQDWKDMVLRAAKRFALRYPQLNLRVEANEAPDEALSTIELAVAAYQLSQGMDDVSGKLAILIDEYDTPFNKNLDVSEDDLVRKGGAFYESLEEIKSFYSTLKSILSQNPNFRIYITGVASLTLSGLTSGFNVDEDISMDVTYDTLCGLEEDEVREGVRLALLTRKFGDGGKTTRAALRLRAASDACESDDDDDDGQTVQGAVSTLSVLKSEVDNHMELMVKMYNGYQFAQSSKTRLYNPTMVAAYLAALTKKGFVEEHELRQVKIELPETAAGFRASRPGATDLVVKLAADVPEELPDCSIKGQLTPGQLRTANRDDVNQMLFLQFGAATFWRSESGDTVKLRRPNENVRGAILQQLLDRTSEDQKNRLRKIMSEFMKAETLSSEALLPTVRAFVKEALNFEAVGTPISDERWEAGGRLEADFQLRLVTAALMSAELAQVCNVLIEAKTKNASTGSYGYYDIIFGRVALELKVIPTNTAAQLAVVLASELKKADLDDVSELPDDVLLGSNSKYGDKLTGADKQIRDYDANALGVQHKFAVLQILPNRALVQDSSSASAPVRDGDGSAEVPAQ